MSDAIIVLNAGSSSLKFSIYDTAHPDLNLVARGQIEGLGISPRFKAKDQQGQVLTEATLNGSAQGFGHPEAFAHVAQWVRAIRRQISARGRWTSNGPWRIRFHRADTD